MVLPSSFFSSKTKWSKLRDSSLCLLVKQITGLNESQGGGDRFHVQVPYSLFVDIANFSDAEEKEVNTPEQQAFVKTIRELHKRVDALLFDLHPLQSWEKFGAYFYSLKVNSFLILGKSCVSLGEFFRGALVAENIRDIQVNLVPAEVFICQDAFGADTTSLISRQNNPLEVVDWIKTGRIAVNGDGGEGVDIFFAERNAVDNKVVVFVDQRKRIYGKFYPSRAKSFLEKLSVCPEFLQGSALVVRGVMNCVSLDALGNEFSVPSGCFLMSREQSMIFHGSLAYHPACTPYISINSSCKTALKTVFKGTEKAINHAVEKILVKRKEISGGFQTREDLEKFLSEEQEDVELIDDVFVEFGF